MNKNIIIAILFLLIGFGLGFFYPKNFSSVNTAVDNQEVKTETQEQSKTGQNKLFAFFESFNNSYKKSVANQQGNIFISEIEPNLGLLIFSYSTSPESSKSAIYDYKNNLIYDAVGEYGLGKGNSVLSFIDNSNVLIYTYNEGASIYKLTIKNFITGSVVDVPIKIDPSVTKVKASLEAENNHVIIWVTNGKITTDYSLNLKTLEVKKIK